MPIYPTLEKEQLYWNQDYQLIAGMDEVGRGCLAGPVVVCAVVIDKNHEMITGVRDSKSLSAKQRKKVIDLVKEQELTYAVTSVSHQVIDNYGIVPATLAAMKQAVKKLNHTEVVLIDGRDAIDIPQVSQVESIIKGDRDCYSIALASIIAKEYRDGLMKEYAKAFSEYAWEKNVGYGTKAHREAILQYGLTPYHRKTFCKKLLQSQ